jgi:hypothetical protein
MSVINCCCYRSANSGNTLLPILSTLADGNEYENKLARETIRYENVHLSWIAICPTDAFENSWRSSFSDIGLDNRLFLVPGLGAKEGIPEALDFDPSISEQIAEIYDWVTCPNAQDPTMPDGRRIINISAEAKGIHDNWVKYHLLDIEQASRIDTYAIRFYLLFACSKKSYVVTPDIVQKTIELMNWQLAVRKYLQPVETKNNVALFELKIRKFFENRIKQVKEAREYTSKIKCNLARYIDRESSEPFRKAIHQLEVAQSIKVESGDRGKEQITWIEE